MTLEVNTINLTGNAIINGASYSNGTSLVSYSNGAALTFNTTTVSTNTYWIRSLSTGKKNIVGITHGNGIYVAVSSANSTSAPYIETSTDGITWTNRTSANTTSGACCVAYGNGVFVIGGFNGMLQSSTDGVTWTNRTRANTNQIIAMTYGNGVFVATGGFGSIVTSTDGTTWTNRTTANSSQMNAAAYGNGVFVIAGSSGATQTSTNGTTWTNQTRANTNNINTITYGNGLFVTGGLNGAVTTSSNGTTWTNQTGGNANGIYSSTFYSNTFINFHFINNSNFMNLTNIAVTTSSNGTSWAQQNTVPYIFPLMSSFSNTVAITGNNIVIGVNPSVDTTSPNANNGSFNNDIFFSSPSFPNKITYTYTDNANSTSLAIKNTSSASVISNNYIYTPSITVNNYSFSDLDGLVNTQIFTANNFWIKPSWANTGYELVIVQLIGAGGGSIKNSHLTTAAGGGGGAFVWGVFMASQCDPVCNVVVGLGGAGNPGATSGQNSVATNGGNTVFYHSSSASLFLTAFGGRGGGMNYTAPNAGQFYGGGGGGWLNNLPAFGQSGSATPDSQVIREYGGDPMGGIFGWPDSTGYGGGGGSNSSYPAGISIYGGGGGGGLGASGVVRAGGNSFFGGGGGGSGNSAGDGGKSLFLYAGNGGTANSSGGGTPPGIGGGGCPLGVSQQTTTIENGARGQAIIYTIRKLS